MSLKKPKLSPVRGKYHRISKVPKLAIRSSGFGRVSPLDIYNYSVAFRKIYEKSVSLSQYPDNVKEGFPLNTDDMPYVNAIPQSLSSILALSNELLLKAVLLGSKGEIYHGHKLKALFNKLDSNYQKCIESHFEKNGLKAGRLTTVLDTISSLFTEARYGFEDKEYTTDFKSLILLNEALDYIYNNLLPDWYSVMSVIDRKSNERDKNLRGLISLVLDPNKLDELSKALIKEMNDSD